MSHRPDRHRPIFLAVTAAQDKRAKIRTAIETTLVATLIMVFFAHCGLWMLRYLQICEPAFKIADGVILFHVACEMLTSKRQAGKRRETTGPALAAEAGTAEAGAITTRGKQHTKDTSNSNDEPENVAIFPLAIPMLARPAAIMSVMVVSTNLSDSMVMSLTG